MKRIDGYILRTVIGASLIALLVLVALETFFTLLVELEDLGTGQYGLAEILRYLALTLPRRAYESFPMALLLGGLMGMGALAAGSELVVMRGAGVSILRLVGSAMRAGLLLSLFALALGEFVAPRTERLAETGRSTAKDASVTIRDGRGFWARDGALFVNVRAVKPHKRLADITLFEMAPDSSMKAVIRAPSADYDPASRRWVLRDARRSTLGEERVTADAQVSFAWESVLDPGKLDVLAAKPETLAMRQLQTFAGYLRDNGLSADRYELAFWSKALAPLANLTMLLIAMPFVFAHQRNAAAGQRLLIGIFLGLAFFLANRVLANLVVVYGAPPLMAAALPILLFLGSGIFALRRLR